MTSPDLEVPAILLGIAVIACMLRGVSAALPGLGGASVIVLAMYFAMRLIDTDLATTKQVAVGTSLTTIVCTSISRRALRACFGIFLGLTSIRMFFDFHAALQGKSWFGATSAVPAGK